MELKDRLEICRKCQNRKLREIGPMICGLTNEVPSFEQVCTSFIRDESEPETSLDDHFHLKPIEIREKAQPIIYDKIINDQDFTMALIGGISVSVIGAILWALISLSGFQFGFMAVGIGALVGFVIKQYGKGIFLKFAIAGSIISLLGCLLGNLLTVLLYVSKEYKISFFDVFSQVSINNIPQIMIQAMHPIDFIFYAIAIYEGYRFSTKKFTERSLWEYTQKILNNKKI